ncbi:hypothetical protein PR048_024898 [Dryococelus australis]|uniref:FP protein C-terminal domain-containing protein n=1 Tax=Dryococelus australis TaxID=614101 RepID=A0ABQ9GPY7_9NEOP|nr:hypothetical protein PR048_024898 [Dryococelus australis]
MKNTESLTDAVKFCSDSFDDVIERLKGMEIRIRSIEALNTKMVEMEDEVENIEAYLRRNNLEINGTSEEKNDDLYEIAIKMSTALNVQLKKDDIDILHRVLTKNQEIRKPIVMKLTNRWMKQELLEARKNKRSLSTTVIGFGEKGIVFVNEHPTPQNMVLFEKERDMRSKGYSFARIKEGKVFLRKIENDKVIHIKNRAIMKEIDDRSNLGQ